MKAYPIRKYPGKKIIGTVVLFDDETKFLTNEWCLSPAGTGLEFSAETRSAHDFELTDFILCEDQQYSPVLAAYKRGKDSRK